MNLDRLLLIHLSHNCLCVTFRMPGRHRGIGMNRPKKKKVEAREEVVEAPEETGITGEVERSPSPVPPVPPTAPSPGRVKRKEAQDESEKLYEEYQVYEGLRCDAEKEFVVAERIHEVKMRRIDAALLVLCAIVAVGRQLGLGDVHAVGFSRAGSVLGISVEWAAALGAQRSLLARERARAMSRTAGCCCRTVVTAFAWADLGCTFDSDNDL